MADEICQRSKLVSYGWGMVPADVAIGDCTFYMALFRRDSACLVPLTNVLRKQAAVTAGDMISVTVALRPPKA